MNTTPTTHARRFGSCLIFQVRAWLAVSALAALALTSSSFAQAPTFNSVIATPTGSAPWQPPRPAAVADFNGDGKLDAFIVDGSDAIRFLRGNGDGTFSPISFGVAPITSSNVVNLNPALLPYLPHGVDGYGIARTADLNGDGKPDVVCMMVVHLNWNPYSFITVMINTGNDANGVPQFAVTHYSLNGYDFRSITVGDLNGDGKPDFIVGGAYGQVLVYLNNGDGTFTAGQTTTIMPNVGGSVGQGVIADVNGDGKADFIVTDNQAGATDVFFGNGDGTLQAPVVIPNSAIAIAIADVNKDGKPDLIEGFGDGSVSVSLNDGHGNFGSPTSFQTVTGGGVSGFFVADVNGDGNLDVALSLYNTGQVAILTGNGDGTFGSPYLYGGLPHAVDVTLADFTGDGKPEIASSCPNGYGGQTYNVLTNTTVFTPPLPTQTLTILGGSGNIGDVAANVEYYNPATGVWQPAYLADFSAGGWPVTHPWGNITGTSHWINYRVNGVSDPGAGPTTNQTLWYLYRVRFTVPSDAVNPKMTFSVKADNFAQVAINGVAAGGSTQTINYTSMNNVIVGQADQLNADAVFSQAVHPGENTITINVGDYGGLNGFNFRIDLSMQSSQPLAIVPAAPADKTPPVISAPANITKEATSAAGAVVTFTASATDNVDGPVNVVASPASGSTFPIATTVVGLAASDKAGNTASASFKVTVQDTTPPVVTAPGNVVAEATSANGAIVTYSAATATDAVGVTSIAYSQNSGTQFALGATTVNITAKDAAGNAGTGSFTVTVQDTTPPAITSVPANIVAEATSASGAAVTYAAATATDAVGVASITYSKNSGATFPIGTTTVVVTAKDAAGNASTASFTVTVRDTTAPTIASVTPSSATLWPPNHQMVPITVSATATDNTGVTSLKIISVTSSEPDNGLGDGDTPNDIQITGDLTVNLRAERSGTGSGRTYTITVEARDAYGNASTKTCTVFVPKSQGGK